MPILHTTANNREMQEGWKMAENGAGCQWKEMQERLRLSLPGREVHFLDRGLAEGGRIE